MQTLPVHTATQQLSASLPSSSKRIEVVEKTHDPILPFSINSNTKSSELEAYFLKSYSTYESLFASIRNEASFYTKPEPLRHPLIFYLGHTACVYINKLVDAGLLKETVNKVYETMFAVGVNEMSWDDLSDEHYSWPSLPQTWEFRQKVKAKVLSLIRNFPCNLQWDQAGWALLMGIEHEYIHLETSAMIIRKLPIDEVMPLPQYPICPYSKNDISQVPKNSFETVPEFKKHYKLSTSDLDRYAWDNQIGEFDYEVAPFKASKYLVSNAEFYEFYADNGYKTEAWWSKQGWAWRSSVNAQAPFFWLKVTGAWQLRTTLEEISMPWDWPVEVNNHEARAFCNWKSAKSNTELRLPTEPEYQAMLATACPSKPQNHHLKSYFSSTPIDLHPANQSLYDVVGNVWQHTCTLMHMFPGHRINPYYEDYSIPCCDEHHDILRGTCWISCGSYGHPGTRNYFRRHFYQFAGFRYVTSQTQCTDQTGTIASLCEKDRDVQDALYTHYLNKPNYVAKIEELLANLLGQDRSSAVTVGCSVGGISFMLAKYFSKSIGLDCTTRFFLLASKVQSFGELVLGKGKTTQSDKLLSHIDPTLMGLSNSNSVGFFQQRPDNIDKKKFNDFSLVFVDGVALHTRKQANLQTIISKATEHLKMGGTLVVTAYDKLGLQNQQDLDVLAIYESIECIFGKHQKSEKFGLYCFRKIK